MLTSMVTITPLMVSAAERRTLEAIVRSGTIEARLSRRARAILLLAEGASVRSTARQVGLAPRMVQHWKHALLAHRVAGLRDAPRAGRPKRIMLAKEARILAHTQQHPPVPLTHWSSRRMATRHGVSQSFVARLWRRHGLQAPRIAPHLPTSDPQV